MTSRGVIRAVPTMLDLVVDLSFFLVMFLVNPPSKARRDTNEGR
jgi:hypothetical protein